MKKMKLLLASLLALSLCACVNQVKAQPIPFKETTPLKQVGVAHELEEAINNKSYTMDNPYVKVNPYGISPLSVFISFKADNTKTYTIVVKSNEQRIADLSYFFANTDTVVAALAGLNVSGDTEIEISDGETTKLLNVKADTIPDTAHAKAEITANEINLDPNHLVFTSPSANGVVSAYDTIGNLRFVLDGPFTWDVNVTDSHELIVSNDTLIELPYYMSGFYTIDFTGHIQRQYIVPGGYHHDVDQLPNGNFLVASDDFNGNTVEDVIVELDAKTGEVVKQFDLKTIIDPNTGKSLNWSAKDWFHNNSVEYDPIDNTLIVSGRHQDVVAIIDYDTQELKGLVGDSEGWDESYLPYFYQPIGDDFEFQWAQHAASYNDKHQLMLFDNGMFRSKDKTNTVDAIDNYSRMVIYALDNEKKTIEQVGQYGKQRGYAYYSPYICDVDQIGEHRYLVDSGGISYLQGKINNMPGALTEHDKMETFISVVDNYDCVWEMNLPTNVYRSEYIDVNDVKFNGVTFQSYGEMALLDSIELESFDTDHAKSVQEAMDLGFTLYNDGYRVVCDSNVNRKDTLSLVAVGKTKIQQFDIQNEKEVGMCVSIFNEEDEKNHLIQSIPLIMLEPGTHFYYIYNNDVYDTGYVLE